MMGYINNSMTNVSARLASFRLVPKAAVQCDTADCQNEACDGLKVVVGKQTSFIKLARAGFFYAGIEAGIRCFSCHAEYSCWDRESPVGVHRILNPECPYLNSENSVSLSESVANIRRNMFTTDTQETKHNCTTSHQPTTNIGYEDSQRPDETPPRPESLNSNPDSTANRNVTRNLFPSNRTNEAIITDTDSPSRYRPTMQMSETNWLEHGDEYTGKIIQPKIGDKKLMARESFRILTFPDPTNSKAEEWAEKGFVFYEENRVRCVYCGGCASFNENCIKTIHQRISPVGRFCCPVVSGVDVGDVSRELEKLVRQKLIYRNNQDTNSRNLYSVCHPQYKSLHKRVISFKFWPRQYKPTKTQLSEAGFFHTGVVTKVICFCCGVAVIDWEPIADPWEQHALISPTCGFIKHEKGEDFIQQMADIEKLVDEDPEVTEPVTVMGDLVIPDPYPPTLDSTLLAAYSSCGYPPQLLLHLIQQIFKQTRGRYPSLPMLKAAVLADGELRKKEDIIDLQGEQLEKKDQQLERLDLAFTIKDQHYKTTVANINQECCQKINNKDHQLQQLQQRDHQHIQQLQQKDHQHIQQLQQKDHQIENLCNRLQTAVNRHEEREESLVQDNISLVQEIARYETEIERQKAEIHREIEKYQTELSTLAAEYTRFKSADRQGSPLDPESQNDRICLFCVSEERIVMLKPCRHVCCCTNCAPHFINSVCPLCRVNVEDWEVVFLS